MKELFALGQGVEGGIKKLKPKMKLEQFGCRKQDGVYQDFYAHIFMMNMFALIGSGIQEEMDRVTIKSKARSMVPVLILQVRAKTAITQED